MNILSNRFAVKIFLVAAMLCCNAGRASVFETVIPETSLDNYSSFESYWNYLYPWGSDHNGTARMVGSSSDHSHISISSGILTLTATRISANEGTSSADPHLPIHYHSGTVYAKQQVLINSQFPDYEVRAVVQAPSGAGTWPAFWATGVNSWPPESDIMEFKGSNTVWQNTYTGSWQSLGTAVSNPGNWHTYRAWMTKVNDTDIDIHYYIDGVWKAQHRATNFVGKPMWIILDLQMEGSSGSSGPSGSTVMKVDSVYVGRTNTAISGSSSSSASTSASSSKASSSSSSKASSSSSSASSAGGTPPAMTGTGDYPAGFSKCADLGGTCSVAGGSGWTAFGRKGHWVAKYVGVGNSIACTVAAYGSDPGGNPDKCSRQN